MKRLKIFFNKASDILWLFLKKSDYHHEYINWQSACNDSLGYDNDKTIKKHFKSVKNLISGNTLFTRDGIDFHSYQFNYYVSTYLLKSAIENNLKLNVLDFGGSFGTAFFNYNLFIKDLKSVSWNIVEQPKKVELGNSFFSNTKFKNNLKFFTSIEHSNSFNKSNIFISCAVIQYVPKPYDIIRQILNSGIKYLIFERVSFIESKGEIISVQNNISSDGVLFPCWFLNEDKFLNSFSSKYYLTDSSISKITKPQSFKKKHKLIWKDFVFKLKK